MINVSFSLQWRVCAPDKQCALSIRAATRKECSLAYRHCVMLKNNVSQPLCAQTLEKSRHGIIQTTNLVCFLQFHKYLLNYYHIFHFLKTSLFVPGKNRASERHIPLEAHLRSPWRGGEKASSQPSPNNRVFRQESLLQCAESEPIR